MAANLYRQMYELARKNELAWSDFAEAIQEDAIGRSDTDRAPALECSDEEAAVYVEGSMIEDGPTVDDPIPYVPTGKGALKRKYASAVDMATKVLDAVDMTLRVSTDGAITVPLDAASDTMPYTVILEMASREGGVSVFELDKAGIDKQGAKKAIKEMVADGRLRVEGIKRGSRYFAVTQEKVA